MKPQIIYLVCADKVIVEAGSNKVSLIGIFQNVNIPMGQTKVIVPLVVSARIKGVDGEITAKVSILDPEKNEISAIEISGSVQPSKRLNLHAQFPFVEFTKFGRHQIRISINDVPLPDDEEHYITVKNQ